MTITENSKFKTHNSQFKIMDTETATLGEPFTHFLMKDLKKTAAGRSLDNLP
jgi:hypothetical protein